MKNSAKEEMKEAIKPITSLIDKSEKAQRKLKPGTWQHAMLRENLRALHIAQALMNGRANKADALSREDLLGALHAFAAMTIRSEKAQVKFKPGTSQHTLQRNRLNALRAAEARINAELK